jgi:hypothetical protein
MSKVILLLVAIITSTLAYTQKQKTENLIVVTLDGMRWQEIFGGADERLLNDTAFTQDSASMKRQFWAATPQERRQKLFPFLWSTIQQKGQLYGNRWEKNEVNNANKYWFSYPGYNEIFTGFPDDSVNSNDKIWNKNINVLEFINKQPAYKNKVAAFATWDVFPYILNEPRSGVYVNADVDTLTFQTKELQLLNDMQFLTTRPIGVRPDVITYFAAREYLKAYSPKVLYIAFDETDDFAHAGMYDQYLGSAHAEDAMIADLWKLIQSTPKYKDKTTLLITCDHGRGDAVKEQWKDHGQKVADAGQIWIAAIGPDSSPLGEVKKPGTLYQRQLASTMAALLGMEFLSPQAKPDPIKSILQ